MAHLEDLFSDGQEIEITYPGKDPVTIWMTRPSVVQHNDVIRKARGAKARRKAELIDTGTDERLAIDLEVDALTKAELVDRMLDKVSQEFFQQATNEVMLNPDVGSDWGSEGEEYLALLEAVMTRLQEIQDHNLALIEADQDEGQILPAEDEELLRLNVEQQRFSDEVQARTDFHRDQYRAEIAQRKTEELRKQYRNDVIERECDMTWFEEYRKWQVYYACRYPDNHQKLYFSSADKLLSLPPALRAQVFDAFDRIDLGGGDTKNWLTSLSSSLS